MALLAALVASKLTEDEITQLLNEYLDRSPEDKPCLCTRCVLDSDSMIELQIVRDELLSLKSQQKVAQEVYREKEFKDFSTFEDSKLINYYNSCFRNSADFTTGRAKQCSDEMRLRKLKSKAAKFRKEKRNAY